MFIPHKSASQVWGVNSFDPCENRFRCAVVIYEWIPTAVRCALKAGVSAVPCSDWEWRLINQVSHKEFHISNTGLELVLETGSCWPFPVQGITLNFVIQPIWRPWALDLWLYTQILKSQWSPLPERGSPAKINVGFKYSFCQGDNGTIYLGVKHMLTGLLQHKVGTIWCICAI